MSTVYAKQYGRMGNNLFQKAAAIGYSITHGLDYDLTAGIGNGYSQHCRLIIESGHQYQELPPTIKHDNRNVLLDGYWQSEKYFNHCREEVLKAFGYQWLPVLPETCAIHVRRGDYLKYPDKHPVITWDYMYAAIESITSRTSVKRFIFFSDDMEWCEYFYDCHCKIYKEYSFEFSKGRTEKEDLELMSSCQHQIISNSTFSWWGAWLNQNSDKVVISPSKHNWFGPGNAHLSTDDIIPDSWIQITY